MTKRVLLIAFLGAALIFLVRLFELKYLEGELSMKLYMLLIGVLFAGIGLWFGLQFRKREVIRSTENEGHSMEPFIANLAGENSAITPPPSTQHSQLLTTRETELLQLLAQGFSNKEIAEQIFVSENTVKKHLANIYRKLEVSRRTQAVNKARELGILSP